MGACGAAAAAASAAPPGPGPARETGPGPEAGAIWRPIVQRTASHFSLAPSPASLSKLMSNSDVNPALDPLSSAAPSTGDAAACARVAAQTPPHKRRRTPSAAAAPVAQSVEERPRLKAGIKRPRHIRQGEFPCLGCGSSTDLRGARVCRYCYTLSPARCMSCHRHLSDKTCVWIAHFYDSRGYTSEENGCNKYHYCEKGSPTQAHWRLRGDYTRWTRQPIPASTEHTRAEPHCAKCVAGMQPPVDPSTYT